MQIETGKFVFQMRAAFVTLLASASLAAELGREARSLDMVMPYDDHDDYDDHDEHNDHDDHDDHDEDDEQCSLNMMIMMSWGGRTW